MTVNNTYTTYLALGSNLGDTEANIFHICSAVEELVGKITKRSEVITTEPQEFESPHLFSNAVIEVETSLDPFELLEKTREIERRMGRSRKSLGGKYEDRVADVDIILYEQVIYSSEDYVLPHPKFRKRAFVLEPLCEIAPDVMDPCTMKSARQLLEELRAKTMAHMSEEETRNG